LNLVLLSGGSGKRLWPLSNEARSKQFLKVLEDKNGELESMVQRVWKQLKDMNLASSTVIATSKGQVEMIQSQLDYEVPLVIEPERRDTFPAIALAASYLYTIKRSGLNETVAILPVDPYVDNDFFSCLQDLDRVLEKTDAQLALIGVKPTYPSTKYGYIIPKADESIGHYNVSHFREKPDEYTAKQLISQNALWNCGVFAFKLGYIISLLEEKGLPTNYFDLLEQYSKLPKNSFDYEVVEKSKKIVGIEYNGYWKDLGTWNTLTDEMGSNFIGKGKMSEDCYNTHILNELDIPILTIGLNQVVVVASPDGILVADKNESPRVKTMLEGYNALPMYEERRWGWYKVLDYTKVDEKNEVLTKRICIKAGKNLSYHKHYARYEVWTIIKGQGEMIVEDQLIKIETGQVIEIPIETMHAIKALTDLEIIEIQRGSHLIEEDILRINIDWEEMLKLTNNIKVII
jgi:mannose-1-phosphate guanylyltransferase